jgi:hypothetical protein
MDRCSVGVGSLRTRPALQRASDIGTSQPRPSTDPSAAGSCTGNHPPAALLVRASVVRAPHMDTPAPIADSTPARRKSTSGGSIFRKCAKGGAATRARSRPSPVDRRTSCLGSQTMASDTPTNSSVMLTRAADTRARETRSLDHRLRQADGARRNAVDRHRQSCPPARFANDPLREGNEPRSAALARDRQGDDRDRCSPRSPRLADGRLGPGHDPARRSHDRARLAAVSN